jgi:hypothetical protein
MISLGMLDARTRKVQVQKPACGNDEQACKDLKNPCQCYCAYKPGPRDKTKKDKPVFIQDDERNINCYCQQRDIDKLEADQRAQEEIETQD